MNIINDIYQQFKDYFGEEKVDLQDFNSDSTILLPTESHIETGTCKIILVHWPEVVISNEYDEHITIWNLYAAVVIRNNGMLATAPMFNRSTYDAAQWQSDYMHSHISTINKSHPQYFHYSCLGSGPIRGTIIRLEDNDYTDMDIWNLFCWELDKYVHVESLNGIPYHKMRTVGNTENSSSEYRNDYILIPSFSSAFYRSYNNDEVLYLVKATIKTLIENNVLKFTYVQGSYTLATDYITTILNISNAFIELYNKDRLLRSQYPKCDLFEFEFLDTVIISGNSITSKSQNNIPIEIAAGITLFSFKGTPVTLKALGVSQDYSANDVNVINLRIIDYIIYLILKYVNAKYGKQSDTSNKKTRIF